MLGELLVAKFAGGLFGFIPMCDSNGEVFVFPWRVIRSVFILSAKSESTLYGVLFLSILNDPNLCFSVWIICSTIPISVLSFTGANISLMSIVLHNSCSFWAPNVCALSHPKLRGTPLFELYRFPKLWQCLLFCLRRALLYGTLTLQLLQPRCMQPWLVH